MSLSLLLQQCPACLVRRTWMISEMGGKWLYSFVGCCFQDLLVTAISLLVQLSLSFFSIHFVSLHVVHPYSSMDSTAAWKKLYFILSERSDLHMTHSISIAVHASPSCILMHIDVIS